MVTGGVTPLVLKPAPDKLIWLMVMLAVPELLTVTDFVLLLPVTTLPNARLVGFRTS